MRKIIIIDFLPKKRERKKKGKTKLFDRNKASAKFIFILHSIYQSVIVGPKKRIILLTNLKLEREITLEGYTI